MTSHLFCDRYLSHGFYHIIHVDSSCRDSGSHTRYRDQHSKTRTRFFRLLRQCPAGAIDEMQSKKCHQLVGPNIQRIVFTKPTCFCTGLFVLPETSHFCLSGNVHCYVRKILTKQMLGPLFSDKPIYCHNFLSTPLLRNGYRGNYLEAAEVLVTCTLCRESWIVEFNLRHSEIWSGFDE